MKSLKQQHIKRPPSQLIEKPLTINSSFSDIQVVGKAKPQDYDIATLISKVKPSPFKNGSKKCTFFVLEEEREEKIWLGG